MYPISVYIGIETDAYTSTVHANAEKYSHDKSRTFYLFFFFSKIIKRLSLAYQEIFVLFLVIRYFTVKKNKKNNYVYSSISLVCVKKYII